MSRDAVNGALLADESRNSILKADKAKEKVLSSLGMARRAGCITFGFDAVCTIANDTVMKNSEGKSISSKAKSPALILFAGDISSKTAKELRYKITKVEIVQTSICMEEISKALGIKAPVGVVAVEDCGFALAIKKNLKDI